MLSQGTLFLLEKRKGQYKTIPCFSTSSTLPPFSIIKNNIIIQETKKNSRPLPLHVFLRKQSSEISYTSSFFFLNGLFYKLIDVQGTFILAACPQTSLHCTYTEVNDDTTIYSSSAALWETIEIEYRFRIFKSPSPSIASLFRYSSLFFDFGPPQSLHQ